MNKPQVETWERSNGFVAAYNPQSDKTTDRAGKVLSNAGGYPIFLHSKTEELVAAEAVHPTSNAHLLGQWTF